MNIVISSSKAIKDWLKARVEIDFAYHNLNSIVFKMIDKEDTNVFGMLSPSTVADFKHAIYFHIKLTRPKDLLGKPLNTFTLSDVESCKPELLEIQAKTLDKWPVS